MDLLEESAMLDDEPPVDVDEDEDDEEDDEEEDDDEDEDIAARCCSVSSPGKIVSLVPVILWSK